VRFEPNYQPVPIRPILSPPRQLNRIAGDSLQPKFEKPPIADFEQPIGDVDTEIRIDSDQVSIEGRVMELG
jgi:hypothetical protein